MAQGAVAPPLANGGSLTAEELREILEYERIVQFRDNVLAGTHPRIKIPPHLAGKQIARGISSPNSTTPRPNLSTPATRTTPGSRTEDSTSFFNRSPINPRLTGGAHIHMSSKSEINPILLEKSDDLIKAEIQLQRQRLERGLRDQIEQQRIAAKALLQTSESLPNFDLSEVLSKALAIVHPSTAPEVEPSAAASDSFDENTFYSSQHDTPEPSSPVRAQNDTAELQSQNVSLLDQRPERYSAQNQVEDSEVVMTGTSLHNDNNLAMQARTQLQHSQLQKSTSKPREQRTDLGNSESSSSSGDVISTRAQGTVNVSIPQNISPPSTWCISSDFEPLTNSAYTQTTTQDLLKQAFDNIPTSPLVRAHNLSPIAPQPARVSPLATARDPPILREHAAVDEMQPAQVSTLRNQPTGISSTDSSPKGTKASDKKKEKEKKKRKRKGKETADTPDSPYIKPEPRSPSPYTAVAPLPRPQKRQRQSGQYAAELNYDEPGPEPVEEVRERMPEQQYREVRAPRIVEREEVRYEPEFRRVEPAYRRVEREDEAAYRRLDGQYERRPQSPVFALPYAPGEVRQVRAASHAVVERRAYDEPRYVREPVVRASVRPEADRERSRSPIFRERRSPIPLAPPRQSMRIVIDDFGRKYYEPLPPPPIRYREPEIVYERAPTRAVSSRVPAEFEEDGIVYRRASPTPAVPRRVVTQPEYAIPHQPEYRSYRQREYSVRPTPMGPPGEEYIQIRSRQLTPEDGRREYIPRAPSAYPEPVRYEIPREYTRMQSVRPEGPPREYAASVRPESRRELVPQSQREYSVRPMDPPLTGISQSQREYSVRPIDPALRREPVVIPEGGRYYEEPVGRQPAEVAFIERPRARESSVMVYADDVRREIYR
ncbi:hypothetical protein BKA61DRAFT_319974 [Leptodontidium sp. MPI-SDFR-AT-0119]|nr:hypothetical protein BKA61DRAFT_319974 [Leptodontidium sp. MPI-SDFR-AT-0119]